MKEMDLREALKWCYNNLDKPLKVNGSSSLEQIRMIARDTTQKDGVGSTETYLLQGRFFVWENLWWGWEELTKPNVTFSLVDDYGDNLKELEDKQRELAKEQERLADEIRRLRQ